MIDSFRTECIQIGTESKNKAGIIKEISTLAKKSDILRNISIDRIEEALNGREELVSTGLSNGIAIPHCSFEDIDKFVVGLMVVSKGVDFDSLDGTATKLIFFIIGPKEKRNKHIKILSSISKLSKDANILKVLAKTDSETAIGDLLKRADDSEIILNKVEKSQFVIHIQKEELFLDVLEILSSEVEGSVSVVDSSSAGNYLNRLPLFATFWNEKVSNFSKIIISVIDKRLMNDAIRRINMVLPEDGKGMIISVTDVIYFDGSIDF